MGEVVALSERDPQVNPGCAAAGAPGLLRSQAPRPVDRAASRSLSASVEPAAAAVSTDPDDTDGRGSSPLTVVAGCRQLSAISPLFLEVAKAHRRWAELYAPWLLEEWFSA